MKAIGVRGNNMKKQIARHLETKWLGKYIIFEEVMDSTNVQAKTIGEENVVENAVVVAGRQTAGRGRRGRNWMSPEGNCYFSVLLKPDIHPEYVSRLTLVTALALAEAITEVAKLEVQIKWPNDIVVNGKKLCGILTEGSVGEDGLKYVVIGVGVNVNQESFDDAIENMATSILVETGRNTDCAYLIGAFLNAFEKYFEQFAMTEDLSSLQKRYNTLLVNRNREVRILGEVEWNGVALGINEGGELLVCDSSGTVKKVFAGEVSVRGLYGYV